jgi:hypothetical protein
MSPRPAAQAHPQQRLVRHGRRGQERVVGAARADPRAA